MLGDSSVTYCTLVRFFTDCTSQYSAETCTDYWSNKCEENLNSCNFSLTSGIGPEDVKPAAINRTLPKEDVQFDSEISNRTDVQIIERFPSSDKENNHTAENDTVSSSDESLEDENVQSDGVMGDYAESGNENDTNDIKLNHTFRGKEETFMTNRTPGRTTDDNMKIDVKSLTTPTTLNRSTSMAYSTNTNYSWGTGNKFIFVFRRFIDFVKN